MMLLTANTYYTVEDLAKRLETSTRSIYRYIDTFKGAGFVLHKNGNIFSLGKESKYFDDISQLVHFTYEEAYIVNQLIDALDDTNMLKQNLRKKLASVYNCTSLADCIVKGEASYNIHSLINAIEEKKQVILHDYASSNTREIRDRRVEPFAFTTNYVSVWCYDCESKSNKVFKTARISKVEVLGEQWTREELHCKEDMDVFRMSGSRLYPIKLEMGHIAHNLLIEEYPLAEIDLRKLTSNKWLLETNVSSFVGVTRFVVGLADDIKIKGSAELQEYVHEFVTKNME